MNQKVTLNLFVTLETNDKYENSLTIWFIDEATVCC